MERGQFQKVFKPAHQKINIIYNSAKKGDKMAEENKNYFPMIAMVAIVAIVALVVLLIPARTTPAVYTQAQPASANSLSDENIAGQAYNVGYLAAAKVSTQIPDANAVMMQGGIEANDNKVTRMEQRPYTCMCASGTCTGTETKITSENEDGGWARSTTTDCGCCGDKAKD